ncbi:MAG: hypothetical protein L6V93_05035 [Clostridiales bacterium]|nr:MAG: hypothetical protein L6V93_05035 [Clostridiales bacterium]
MLVGTDYKSAFNGDFGTITFVSYDGGKYNAVIIDSYEKLQCYGCGRWQKDNLHR